MTEFIKGVSNELLKSSVVALILGIIVYFLYGDGKLERTERIAELKASAEQAATFAKVLEQNSQALQEVKFALTSGNQEIREVKQMLQGILRPFSPRVATGENP